MRRALIAALALTAIPLSAAAQNTSDKVGGWEILTGTAPEAGQPLNHLCRLWSPTNEGHFRLINRVKPGTTAQSSPRGAADLRFRVPDQLVEGAKGTITDVTFSIPGQAEWKVPQADWEGGLDIGNFVIAFVEDRVDRVIPALAKGRELQLKVKDTSGPEKTYSVPLKGSGAALAAFEKCLADVRWQ